MFSTHCLPLLISHLQLSPSTYTLSFAKNTPLNVSSQSPPISILPNPVVSKPFLMGNLYYVHHYWPSGILEIISFLEVKSQFSLFSAPSTDQLLHGCLLHVLHLNMGFSHGFFFGFCSAQSRHSSWVMTLTLRVLTITLSSWPSNAYFQHVWFPCVVDQK